MTEEEYRRRVAAERDLGLSQVRIMLDELCERLGWEAVEWRLWPDSVTIL